MIKYFGTDGIRGVVGKTPITADFFFKLGAVIGKILYFYDVKKIIIGRDTRLSSYMLEEALQFGLSLVGVSVISVGVLPTPAISYFTKLFNLEVGVVISASHNQFRDNGIKFFVKNGVKLSAKFERRIEKQLNKTIILKQFVDLGHISYKRALQQKYINFCISTLPNNFRLNNFKIVLDCANGSTYELAPIIFRELGANVVLMSAAPNGLNINDKCGTTDLQEIQRLVLSEKADLGISFDGDGDRVIMIDHFGNSVNGDQILYILAKNYKKNKKLRGGVVGTKMSNGGLSLALSKIGIPFITVNIGDRYIFKKLKEKQWRLGAESSGHVILLDYAPVGDGIITSLQILKIIFDENSTLKSLCSDIHMLPQIIINIKNNIDISFLKNFKIQSVLSKYKDFLGKYSRIMLRLSGTEKCIRIMIEGCCSKKINIFSKMLINVINSVKKSRFSIITMF
ncbi:putative phosphoglucosamine mutase [Buchnera aphidicola str. Bp (Baizongia pistaciae)]|uniref:Phosphoglucosamine mutase n=1 Tax=Buchnera aphidicola subsp. Baizongia pistaciae (strain Bp) TaxID=224915 RepID=GLMM_BUCBP|nr:phosphoglucosamine mutase [Buchnera aphidicola]Q89AF3.1 RecName: Full=Phosphoglucosamine mutase [Buchnera aphidicola str. Bp (Baizongia pistaciae)]AAO27063.1 putative phosphoglucosamine mutase [Buchnera aphidicola str. Bp (Baizongia pistaciae)]